MSHRIVIADDEPYILHVLGLKLRNAGYETFLAEDGEEALELCLGEKPALILTDYQMPGLTGLELCREVTRRLGRTIPAILVTAREFDISDAERESAGVSAVVSKPFSPRQVVALIESVLRGEPPRADVA